jgi:Tfp pilus assembly protein FimT
MIELVFAIVLIGILASLAIPRMDRDLLQEASSNILADIRYTQHLALMDNKHIFDNPRWQRRFWHITFTKHSTDGQYYLIGSDDTMTGSQNALVTRNETAIDPSNGLPMFGTNGDDGTVSPRIFIEKKYGITSVNSLGGCSGAKHLGFDYLGRPYHTQFIGSSSADYSGYMASDCTFTFAMSTDADGNGVLDTFSIQINTETGYAFIVGQNAS